VINIITVVFNGIGYIEKTIQSVINQTYDNFEYIIIDGGSTDGTLDVIKKYENKISHWISEKDNGIYNAMNKGLKYVNQESYVFFLNSGDYLINSNIIEEIAKTIILNHFPDAIYGGVQYRSKNNKTNKIHCKEIRNIRYLLIYNISHQSIFIKFNGTNFNENYNIVADSDMIMKLYLSNQANFIYIPKIITSVLIGGYSANFKEQSRERFLFIKQYLPMHLYLLYKIYYIIRYSPRMINYIISKTTI